jgi:predicted ATPase
LLVTDEPSAKQLTILTAPHNLPSATSAFVGRETELSRLVQLITIDNARLMTILAPGGMGKTRLAVETARQFVTGQQAQRFPQGVYWVALAHIRAAEQIISAIAEQIGIQFYGTESQRQQLLDYFREKRVLLVLDNFEHLLDGTDFIRDLLQVAPHVQLVITSREKLNLQDEAVFTLRGLEFADVETRVDELTGSAVRLFVQHVRLMRHDFTPQAEDLNHLARICQLVQGMPLGLILAAAWVELLSLQEIADEIASNLDFLESQSRDMPDRQRSIRAVFDHAWRRLSPEEQNTFMKLAVFRGGFTRRAAQEITGASLRTLQTLASKALIVRVSDERFEIHELLRQYAEMELEQSGEVAVTRDAHSHYYLNAVAEREADIKGRRQSAAVTAIRADFENVRIAWFHALKTNSLELVESTLETLCWFSLFNASFQEGITLFQAAIDHLSPSKNHLWGKLMLRLLRIERWQIGSYKHRDDAEDLLQHCLSIAEQTENETEIANCLYGLGDYEDTKTMYGSVKALDYLERCTPIYENIGDLFYLAWAYHLRSYSFWLEQPDEAVKLHLQALEIRQRIGDTFGASGSLSNLCDITWIHGRIKESENYLIQATTATKIANQISTWNNIYAAILPMMRGDFARANHLARENLRIAEKANYSVTVYISLAIIGLVAVLREDYTTGQAICERCVPITTKHYIQTFANLGLVIAACSHSDMHGVIVYLATLFEFSRMLFPVVYLFIAPIAAVIAYHTNQLERAAELVGAAYHLYPEVTWYEQWALFSRLRADLRTKLGDDSYESALKRGEQLTMEQIVSELQAVNPE